MEIVLTKRSNRTNNYERTPFKDISRNVEFNFLLEKSSTIPDISISVGFFESNLIELTQITYELEPHLNRNIIKIIKI